MAQPVTLRPVGATGRSVGSPESPDTLAGARLDTAPAEDARSCPRADGGTCTAASGARDLCRRERARLEANKRAAARLLQMFDNPVLARREYNRYVRDLDRSIRLHNAVCKPCPIAPLRP